MKKDKYWLMGPIYERISQLFAGDAIHRCKCAMLEPPLLKAGERVLFAGVGHGTDAIHAARLGAKVTVVDLSGAMLTKFREAVENEEKLAEGNTFDITIYHGDIFAFGADKAKKKEREFDMVVANFFFNLFPPERVDPLMAHLVSLAKVNGNIVVGDFTLPSGSFLKRLFNRAYWYLAILTFWATTGAAIHSVYDYHAAMEKSGLRVDENEKKHTKVLGVEAFTSMLGRKSANQIQTNGNASESSVK